MTFCAQEPSTYDDADYHNATGDMAMEIAVGGNGASIAITDLLKRAHSLVAFLLLCLDEASDYIEELDAAFRTEDAHRALVGNERLQRAWSHAYATIKILELLSGVIEPYARHALSASYRRARPSLTLAWNLISRIPITHLGEQSDLLVCKTPR